MTPLLLAIVLARSARPSVAPDVLANVRHTLLSTALVGPSTILTGTADFRGVSSSYSLMFDYGGQFVQTVGGHLGQTLGCDGRNYWEIDASGATRHLAFEDVDRAEALMLLLTDRWLDFKAPIDRKVEGPDPDGTYKVILSLHVSGLKETVRIDPATWMPSGAEFEIAASKTTIELSDWKAAGPQKVPFVAKVTEAGLTDTYRVDEGKTAPDLPYIYTMPSKSPDDIAYAADVAASVPAKRAPSGHMLVHPRVNGVDVGWFILDSGADSMVIDKSIADSQGLPILGKESVVGVGGVVQEPFRTVSAFTLGPATMRNVNFIEFDLKQLSDYFGVKLAGVVGFDFFRRFIVQIDLKKPSVEIDNVADFHLQQGDWSKIEFSSGNPAVQASFEGDRKGWFRLDTGANGTVTFHSPAVERMHLLDGRQTTAIGMAGVGGVTEARSGKLAWFDLGGHRFNNVAAVFSLAKVGAFADRYLDGNIGQDLMEPFTVVFDFGGSRVALLPH